MKFRDDSRSVIPAIGVVLMVTVTFLAVGSVVTFAFGFSDEAPDGDEVTANAGFSYEGPSSSTVTIWHNGGYQLSPSNTEGIFISVEASGISSSDLDWNTAVLDESGISEDYTAELTGELNSGDEIVEITNVDSTDYSSGDRVQVVWLHPDDDRRKILSTFVFP